MPNGPESRLFSDVIDRGRSIRLIPSGIVFFYDSSHLSRFYMGMTGRNQPAPCIGGPPTTFKVRCEMETIDVCCCLFEGNLKLSMPLVRLIYQAKSSLLFSGSHRTRGGSHTKGKIGSTK